MKVREVMTQDPITCVASDSAQTVAALLRKHNIGSMPVVSDKQSGILLGVITDRDLCVSVVAEGLDPKRTTIEKVFSNSIVTCREGENVEKCERAMQEHQVRRIPVVDAEGHCIGIVAQADLALKEKEPEKVSKTVAEISKPQSGKRPVIAA